MNLIIELKFLFRNYFFKSFPIEIREGILAFREIKEKFKNNLFVFCIWEAVSLNIERTLITNQIWFIDSVKKQQKQPRELIYIWILNNTKDELEFTDAIEFSKIHGLEKAIIILNKELNPLNKNC
jgi:hypothetical protein